MSFLVGLVLLGFVMIVLAQPVGAALPPLSAEEREEQSSCVVTGIVKHIWEDEREGGMGMDIHYRVVVEIEKLEKSCPIKDLKVGTEIEVRYWQAAERSLGWGGNSGQYIQLRLGKVYRLFLVGGSRGYFMLLEPNGCDRLDVDG